MTAPRFDFDVPDVPAPVVVAPAKPQVWREIPQALFLSWPRRKQLAYCARRDEHSSTEADSPADAEWFRQRARQYREEMKHA